MKYFSECPLCRLRIAADLTSICLHLVQVHHWAASDLIDVAFRRGDPIQLIRETIVRDALGNL